MEKIAYGIVFLSCALLGLWLAAPAQAAPRTDNDSIDASCGPDNATKKFLIAYDTIHGSTAEVAWRIGQDLCAQGFKADVKLADNVTDISGYDGFILGSAIYKFTMLSGAKGFLEKYKSILAEKPTAVFIVCSGMAKDTPENRATIKKSFVDPTLDKYPEITPTTVGLFGGAVDFTKEKYNLFEKIVLRILGLILKFRNTADWRNLDAIDAWAKNVGDNMTL